jgi:23S rRNA (uracil1939-C5)-methyltransferase
VRLPVVIEDLAPGGEGVGRGGDRTVFVPFAAPGDRVVVDVPAGEGTAHGTLVSIEAPGADRVTPPCRHFGPRGGPDTECGGCEWLHVGYGRQLDRKARTLEEALRRIGKLEPGAYATRPIVPSPSPLRYRARAKFHLDRAAGRLVFFRRRTHEPVRLAECHLLLPGLDALRAEVGPALAAARLRQARVPGRPEGGTMRSRPDVFQQANRGANALLVETALALLAADGEDVLELHCGAGNFTGPLAARARSVWAVEVQGPALDLARADLAGGKVRFFAGDALKLALAFSREAGGRGRFGAALLDPPREGAKGIGPALRELAVPRVVYVSCDPATLARDLRACVDAGYRVDTVVPVDMFPQTHHVEGVALLVRNPG